MNSSDITNGNESSKGYLEDDLQKALHNNQLYMEYQPKIDIKTQKVSGAEALIRWKHPVFGNVSPAEFLPLAEKSYLSDAIAEFVMNSVYKQIKKWTDDGIAVPQISINLSPKNFLNPSLYKMITNSLNKYHVSPHLLEIEITEDALLENTETVNEQLNKLKEIGVRLALDDLGSGYSSLNYLKQFHFDTVKIDRTYINQLEEKENRLIVKSFLQICKSLKKKVVAEGVETKEQFQILDEMGCDEIQGFYFSRSISGQEMANWFKMEQAKPSA